MNIKVSPAISRGRLDVDSESEQESNRISSIQPTVVSMENFIILDWRIISSVAPILVILAFYFPILIGAMLTIRFLGKPVFIPLILLVSVAVDLLLIRLAFFNPFAKQADQNTLMFGMFATACIGLLLGCYRYLQLSPPSNR
jgi:hypothetical protein